MDELLFNDFSCFLDVDNNAINRYAYSILEISNEELFNEDITVLKDQMSLEENCVGINTYEKLIEYRCSKKRFNIIYIHNQQDKIDITQTLLLAWAVLPMGGRMIIKFKSELKDAINKIITNHLEFYEIVFKIDNRLIVVKTI
ncbi:hypothetical protein RclHR1_03790015 [Rhizophagus clarus]|uniref:Uncharacterized protein n=1 Tax=Rhizophagus clarus TaxID=94130 RepID=A0A2Z6RUJ2_9GLOM|nr:hypothetical protein RclHR1_03790015 [Rhizophagus clarus]GES83575.1 hypothetical protein RCL_jg19849.t1 [Rhizophagus clarus]